MTIKKITAVLLTLAILASFGCLAVSAAGTSFELKLSQDVFTNDIFTADLYVTTDAESLRMCEVTFTYDATVITPVDDKGEAANRINKILIVDESYGEDYVQAGQKVSEGSINYAGIADYQNGVETVSAPSSDKALYSFRFKALKHGNTGLTVTKFTYLATADATPLTLEDATATNNTAAEIKVQDMPNPPSITAATVTGTLKVGEKATASYTWHNGNNEGNTTDRDASEIKWTVGGEAVAKAETDGRLELTLTNEMVGKKLAYTVVPKADRDAALNNNVTAAVASTESEIVMPADDYKPTAEIVIEKITAGKTPEVTVTIDALDAMETSADYKWYVVADAADAVAAIKAVKEADPALEALDTVLATEKLTKDYKDQFAVLEVIAKATIADKTYTATEAVYEAAQIKVKKSGGSAQSGASLVTGTNGTVKPEEPVKPEDPEVPTEPEKDPEDPAGTANDKGAAAFTDVDKEAYAWAYDSIDTLAKAGVIKGMTETTFGPELTTTNAQVIALAVRIAGLTAEEGATTDKVDAEHWVAGEMAIADANEILAVFGDKVDVEGETTREIAFTLLYNALKAAGVELPETAEAIEYSDAASISEGCVEAIEALTKAGIVNGMGDGTLAPKATITRAQLAKILGLAEALIK